MAYVFTPEHRARISAAKQGHTVSDETRAKISASVSITLIGRSVMPETREKIASAQSAERAHNWKGEDVGYGGAHKRHRVALPRECAHCGTTTGRLDVALRHDADPERLRWCPKRERYFSVQPEDYLRLCRACHIAYDRC